MVGTARCAVLSWALGSVVAALRRQRSAYLGFNLCNIGGGDGATSVYVFAKIRHCDRLTDLRFGKAHIRGVDNPITAGIAEKKAHVYRCVWKRLREFIGHVSQGDRRRLFIGDAG